MTRWCLVVVLGALSCASAVGSDSRDASPNTDIATGRPTDGATCLDPWVPLPDGGCACSPELASVRCLQTEFCCVGRYMSEQWEPGMGSRAFCAPADPTARWLTSDDGGWHTYCSLPNPHGP
jgi:hypothetical protein